MIVPILMLAASLARPARGQALPASSLLPAMAETAGPGLDFSRFAAEKAPVRLDGARLVAVGSLGAPISVVPLAGLIDAVRATRAVFYANGTPVHIFGGKSENNLGLTGWFLQLYAEGAPDAVYFNGVGMARVVALGKFWGTARSKINGADVQMHMDIDVLDPQSSKLVVETKGAGGRKSSFTAGDLARAAYDTGYPLRLGGTEYRLFYGRGFMSEKDQFKGYTGDRLIGLTFYKGRELVGYDFREKDIPRDGILVSTPLQSTATEKKVPGDLTLGLRIDPQGNLEIYYPVRLPE